MATSISNFDLFSIVENLIKEEQVSAKNQKKKEESFIEDAENLKIKAPESSKNKNKKTNSNTKKEEEEVELVDKEKEDREEVETPDESPSTLRLADALDYKKFVDDLNKFRAAHSFDDPEISDELKGFFEKLEDDEKKVFYVILKGLIQVTLMGVDGKTARTPSELKFSINKTGNVSSEKKRSMRRKIDISKELNDEDVSDKKVDTNTPIKTIKIGDVNDGVILRQDKTKIYEVLRKNV